MNNKTLKQLAEWVKRLMKEAENDTNLSVSWFLMPDEKDTPFKIVGGWSEGFSKEYADLLYISKSEPKYAMCIKVAVDSGPSVGDCKDFDTINMPTYKHGEVDDTCVPLEQNDDPEQVAKFYLHELERITKEYEADLYIID
jgi:hypothetical protein